MIDAAWIAEARKGLEELEGVTPGEWRAYEHPDEPGEVQIGAGLINDCGDGWDEWCIATVFWDADDNGREPHADHIVRMSSPANATELLRLAEIGLRVEGIEAEPKEVVSRLRDYRPPSANMDGPREHHPICDEAAGLIEKQAAEIELWKARAGAEESQP